MKHNTLKILIIDDNREIHSDFLKILQLKHTSNSDALEDIEEKILGIKKTKITLPKFEIDTATQGEEGLALVKNAIDHNNPYALAFIDIRMPPGWDGITTIKNIWQIDKNIQIVICTAYSDYSWENITEELGEHDNLLILKKPFDKVSVRQLAVALTKKWQLMKENINYTNKLEDKVKERTKSIEYNSNHDILTNLPNRRLLTNYISNLIKHSTEKLSRFSVVFIDIDRFKLINDSFGHDAGDKVLQSIAEKIKGCIRKTDFLARLSGDEFILILNEQEKKDTIQMILKKILVEINKPFEINGFNITLTASFGVCTFPYHGKHFSELLKSADKAMYLAKDLGGNQVQFFKETLNHESMKKLILESELQNAIKNNEFFLMYQPIYDARSKKLKSLEALLRWNHPEKGIIHPIDFIPLAEEIGLFVPLGEWVIRTACKQNKTWQEAGLKPIVVAINIAAQQLKQPGFVSTIKEIISETKLTPQFLEIELTENIILNNDEAFRKINELKDFGIKIAIDDFGAGNSSLNYLKYLPLDHLKIDQSFVKNIDSKSIDSVIIEAIIMISKKLNVDVIAEGVETKSQLDFLVDHLCDNIQGFYFSDPKTSDDIMKLLTQSGE